MKVFFSCGVWNLSCLGRFMYVVGLIIIIGWILCSFGKMLDLYCKDKLGMKFYDENEVIMKLEFSLNFFLVYFCVNGVENYDM